MAKKFAQRGYNLLLLSLPNEKLPEYARELTQKNNIDCQYYESDLTVIENIEAFAGWVKEKNLLISGLVNNAGMGGTSPFHEVDFNWLNTLILTNIRALTLLTRIFIDDLRKSKNSFILNVSSIAAFSPMPYKTIYPASKAFVYYFSLGLREELKHADISVSVLHPGPFITTEEQKIRLSRHGFLARMSTLKVEEVAEISVMNTLAGKKVIIPGVVNKIFYRIVKMIPSQIKMQIFSRVIYNELNRSKVQNA